MPNFDFSHLRVDPQKLTEYAISEIDCPPGTTDQDGRPLRHPVLLLRPATRDTREYWSKVVKRSGRRGARSRITEADVEEGRETDLQLFPRHIVRGWRGVFHADGTEARFSEGECRDFLAALPHWVFTNIQIFAKDPANFVGSDDDPSPKEVTEQGNG